MAGEQYRLSFSTAEHGFQKHTIAKREGAAEGYSLRILAEQVVPHD